MIEQSSPRRSRHLWGIDVVRFAAAVLVAFFHLTWQERLTASIAWYGWIGVQIFFVISGVVIAGSANNTTPSRFIKSRLLRLYPGAWICATLGLLVMSVTNRPEPNLVARFLGSFFLYPVGPYLVSAYWTLPIELAFYALVVLVLLAGSFARLQVVASVLCVASASYIVAFALQCAGHIVGPDLEFGYGWKNMTLLRHGIYFALGVLLWLWSQRRLARWGWPIIAIAVLAAPLEITCRTAELVALMLADRPALAAWSVPVVLWLVSVGFLVWSLRWETRLSLQPAFLTAARAAGLATYPLYLLHEAVGTPLRNMFVRIHVPQLGAVCLAIIISTALALLVAQTIELRLRELMRGAMESSATSLVGKLWSQRLNRHGGAL